MKLSSTKRISLLLVLSLSAHAAVILLWNTGPAVVPQPGGQGLPISMVVQAQRQATTEKPATPASKPAAKAITPAKTRYAQKSIAKNSASKQPGASADPVEEKQPHTTGKQIDTELAQAAQTRASTPVENTGGNTQRTATRRLASVLRKAFDAHFYYPRLAVRRGWQGEVQLGLRIEANGQLSHIKVMQSSGHSLLDKAALNSLNRVQLLPRAIALLNGSSLDLVLPVEYRLL